MAIPTTIILLLPRVPSGRRIGAQEQRQHPVSSGG
jgi:hypothetical protein